MRTSALAAFSLLLLAFSGAVEATSPMASSAEERAALASFEALLDALGRRDKPAMLAHSLPGGHATLMRKGKPVQITLEELADKVTAPGTDTHRETLRAPLVRVDRDLAVVWARFEFWVNDKIDHCGRDVATLVHVAGEWQVASIEDTATTDCKE